jgi:hypothetical protein
MTLPPAGVDMTDRRKSLKKGNDRHRFQVEMLVEEI